MTMGLLQYRSAPPSNTLSCVVISACEAVRVRERGKLEEMWEMGVERRSLRLFEPTVWTTIPECVEDHWRGVRHFARRPTIVP